MSASQIAALAKRGEPTQRVEVRASGPGFVQTLNVREGMYVEPGTTIASIVELSKVWIEGAVPESAAGWMAAGLPVTVRLTAGPDAIRTGRIDYVYPVLDAQTRTLRVRAVFDNADLRLLPGMFAAMTIEGPATTPFVVVPAAAVIRTAASEQVVLALGDGRFRPAEVVVAERVGEWIAVSSGLSAGESVVVSGQFLLDSEASRSAGLLRMLPADDPVSEAPPGHEGHEMPGAHAR